MDNKLISIVIPVHNTEKYLERCLDSLLKQTYPNLQIIVVNDASPGNAKDIVERYQDMDSRILYMEHKKNVGVFAARITGSLKATGDYIAFVDSDDYVGMDFYRLLLEEAERSQSDIVFSRTVIEDRDKVVFGMHDIAFPDEVVEGEAVFDMFLEQEGRCYSWHTLWNKLYRKSLWDTCMPYFQKYGEHINMMEDIACSFILFYFARRISKVENSVYYYCQNAGSATDAKRASFEKFKKNLQDTFKIFEMVKDFLVSVNASEHIMRKYYDFRNYYIRDWKKGVEFFKDEEERRELLEMIDASYGEVGDYVTDDRFFRAIRTLWNDELEEIKRKICSPEYEYISFDIFDTLVTRPFYRPSDLFRLLDRLYEKEYDSGTSFYQIRIDGEIAARELLRKKHPDYQDVTIDEIYDCIREMYNIPESLCAALKEEEKRLEIRFCGVRKTVKELYDLALYMGKKIILVSDMFLDEETIGKILEKNGYEKYCRIFLSSKERLLKHTGDLFRRVLEELQAEGSRILHMGDNHYCDVLKAREAGFHSVHIPRTINVFENRVKGLDTGECSTLAHKVGGVILDGSKLFESTGYGSMAAIAANYYFDNPFRPFNSESDYNADPYFIGYYALGMHLAGLVNWIMEQSAGYERILFMARDGYLVKQAYDIWSGYLEKAPKSEYIYSSRKMLLPVSVASPADFMNLPIVYTQYSPSAILKLLDFCTKNMTEDDRVEIFKDSGIPEDKKFGSKLEYQVFMKLYLEHFYDRDKHVAARELLKKYYEGIKETDIIFDMGYTGSIPLSLARVVRKPLNALYVHSDAVKSVQTSRKGNFRIKAFYDFSPAVPVLLREHILSASHPACIGVRQEGDKVLPVFDVYEKLYTDTFVIDKLHEGALRFIKDYCEYFKGYFEYVPFKNYEVSLPFEAFLRIPKGKDIQIFEGSYFEDKVYGRQEALNIARYMESQYKAMPQTADENIMEALRNALIDNMRNSRKLVYFGTGKKCREFLTEHPDLPVSFFLDNDKRLRGTQLNGKEIRHPDDIENWKDIYIIITTYYSSEIEKQLKNLGLQKHRDFISFQELFKIS